MIYHKETAFFRLAVIVQFTAIILIPVEGRASSSGIRTAVIETKDISLSLFHPSDTGIAELALLGIFTPLVGAGDEQLNELSRPVGSGSESRPLEYYSDAFGVYTIPTAAGLWLAGCLADSDETATLGRDILVAQVVTLAASGVLKTAFGRARPDAEEGNARFHPFTFDDKYRSFPSNHTAVAFATAAVISTRYKNLLVSVPIYTAAVGVAYARVYNRKHWPSDVFASAIIGIAIGRAAGGYNRPDEPDDGPGFSLWFDPLKGYAGVSYKM